MLKRIVLSCVLFSLVACASDPGATADDDPASADGIGTSPSDPEGLVALEALIGTVPDACGLWTRGDASALACAPADVAVWPSAATCTDLIRLADARWPGVAVVRVLDAQLRAWEAACP